MALADRIREKRNRIDMSQQHLANFCGVHVASVRNWEKGSIPREEMLSRIATALGAEVQDLLNDPQEAEHAVDIDQVLADAKMKIAAALNLSMDRVSLVASFA